MAAPETGAAFLLLYACCFVFFSIMRIIIDFWVLEEPCFESDCAC